MYDGIVRNRLRDLKRFRERALGEIQERGKFVTFAGNEEEFYDLSSLFPRPQYNVYVTTIPKGNTRIYHITISEKTGKLEGNLVGRLSEGNQGVSSHA